MKKPIKQTKKQLQERRIVDALYEINNPLRNALIVASIWELILFVFAIVITFTVGTKFVNNINTMFFVGIGIAVLWTLLKWGLLEGPRLKIKNWSNEKIIKTYNLNSKTVKLDIKSYRELNKQRSWWGVYLLLIANIIGVAITMAFVI